MGQLKFLGYLMLVLTVIMVVTAWYTYFETKDDPAEYGKCYDRFKNEILGETCLIKNKNLDTALLTIPIAMIMGIFIPMLFMTDSLEEGGYI
jgi:Na+/melibiose symporter-like transporter